MSTISRQTAIAWSAALGAVVLLPAPVEACAVCFGRSDSPLAQGMNMGILSLMVVILSVLATVAGFFVHLARQANLAAARAGGALAAAPTSSAAPLRRSHGSGPGHLRPEDLAASRAAASCSRS